MEGWQVWSREDLGEYCKDKFWQFTRADTRGKTRVYSPDEYHEAYSCARDLAMRYCEDALSFLPEWNRSPGNSDELEIVDARFIMRLGMLWEHCEDEVVRPLKNGTAWHTKDTPLPAGFKDWQAVTGNKKQLARWILPNSLDKREPTRQLEHRLRTDPQLLGVHNSKQSRTVYFRSHGAYLAAKKESESLKESEPDTKSAPKAHQKRITSETDP